MALASHLEVLNTFVVKEASLAVVQVFAPSIEAPFVYIFYDI